MFKVSSVHRVLIDSVDQMPKQSQTHNAYIPWLEAAAATAPLASVAVVVDSWRTVAAVVDVQVAACLTKVPKWLHQNMSP